MIFILTQQCLLSFKANFLINNQTYFGLIQKQGNNIKVVVSYIISECHCDTMGSNSMSCDSNGSCECKSNDIVGQKCSKCKAGLSDFPLCKGI